MIALNVQSNKNFMKELLMTERFNNFRLMEAVLVTACSFHIDGRLKREFFEQEEWEELSDVQKEEFIAWEEVRNSLYELIKGKKTPVSLKMTLVVNYEWKEKIVSENMRKIVNNLSLNIRYEENSILITTGVAYSDFVLDKTVEAAWDDCLKEWLKDLL